MDYDREIELWSGPSIHDKKYRDVEALLKHFEFVYVRKTNHTHMWKCDDLREHPKFTGGRVQVGEHYQGKQGIVSPQSLKDLSAAVKWVITIRTERKEQEKS